MIKMTIPPPIIPPRTLSVIAPIINDAIIHIIKEMQPPFPELLIIYDFRLLKIKSVFFIYVNLNVAHSRKCHDCVFGFSVILYSEHSDHISVTLSCHLYP